MMKKIGPGTPILAVMFTVILDAVGIGLTMPILPHLLRDVGHRADLGWRFGAFLALYALMQFLFAPILGALSDRFGRRPILLLSLAGATIDYLMMTVAPTLTLLFIGRAIAGLTGANMAVANSYVADVTEEGQRTRRFGQLGACAGIGFIAGPAIGGLLGSLWVRAPFLAAAGLNLFNLIVTAILVRESLPPERRTREPIPLNPTAPLRWLFTFPIILPLIGIFMLFELIGQVGATIWVLYGEDRFAWDSFMIGLSLAGFGLFHALVQAFVAGPVAERLGERRTLLIGIAADTAAYILIAIVTRGWMVFALLPIFCLGALGAPALQSLLSAHVGEESQGRLQGLLSSMTSLISIFGPLVISVAYFATRSTFPGFVWVAGAALYILCLPALATRFPKGETKIPD